MKLFIIFFVFSMIAFPQATTVPSYYSIDAKLTFAISTIFTELDLKNAFDTGEDGMVFPSIALIDLTTIPPRFAGIHAERFIYPASIYKMYVAAEVLHQVSQGKYPLTHTVIVQPPNTVDRMKEIVSDPRPLLRDGDTVNVNYLLELMITRSDNSAANCLIDLARRENINLMMQKYSWRGSEVTRKYLSRTLEDSGYATVKSTETSALHAADFLYRIYTRRLFNPWVSMQMMTLLGRQLDKTKLAAGLPENTMMYHKTGWYASWTHDVGIVDDGSIQYIIACLLPLPEETALPKMKELSKQIYQIFQQEQHQR